MHIERNKLGTMAWYRLTKVIFFVLLSILAIFSILIAFEEPSFGFGTLVFVIVLAEIIRQLFFYIVSGEFLSRAYKINLINGLKIVAVILLGALVIFIAGKVINKVKASVCTSKLGELGTYENGICECAYGYSLENDTCVSNDALCEKKLGKYSIYEDGICRCLVNYSEIDGTCIFTSDICAKQFGNSHALPGQDKCICDDGYQWNDKRDRCVKFVPPVLSEKQKCEKQGFKAKFNVMSNTCECTFNYVMINGVCQEPPYCGQNAHYDEQQKCVCNAGYKKEGDKCIQPDCPLYSSYNSETDKCECNDGYLVRNGQCKSAIELCGLLGKYNPSTGNCVDCGFGYELQGRDCVFTGY